MLQQKGCKFFSAPQNNTRSSNGVHSMWNLEHVSMQKYILMTPFFRPLNIHYSACAFCGDWHTCMGLDSWTLVSGSLHASTVKQNWPILSYRVISVAVAAVRTSLPWNVCIFAVCNRSLCSQLAQMTVTAFLKFLSLKWVQQRTVNNLKQKQNTNCLL